MRWITITKTTVVSNFQFTKFSFIDFVLTDRRSLSSKRQNRLVSNLPVVDFHSQTWEMLTIKPLNAQLSGFFEYIGFLPFLGKFEPHCLPEIRDFWCPSRRNSRKLRQTTCIENREGFAVHSSTWLSGAKGEWRVSSWLAISTHVKKYDIFHVRCSNI